MKNKIQFTLLGLTALLTVSATYTFQAPQHFDEDPEIAKIKNDVEQIATASFISAMTIPDKIESSWSSFEDALKTEVNKRIEINSEKLRQTFARYKNLMEKGIMQAKISDLGWSESEAVSTKIETPCNMACVQYCFQDSNYRFENVEDVYQVCLVPQCNCTTGEVEYNIQQYQSNNRTYGQSWNINTFGEDRDLYDKNGVQIYKYEGDQLWHRDLDEVNDQWLDTWHFETNTTQHSLTYRLKENYYEKLEKYSWISAPEDDLYSLEKDCDLDCSEECLSIRDRVSLDVLDSCNANRCNCFYSAVSWSPCTNSCKRSCLLVPGGKEEIDTCISDTCMCSDSTTSSLFKRMSRVSISDHEEESDDHEERSNSHDEEEESHFENKENEHESDNEDDSHSTRSSDEHEEEDNEDSEHSSDDETSEHASETANTTQDSNVTQSDNQTESSNATDGVTFMAMVGAESLISASQMNFAPKIDIPIQSIVITFSVFMSVVLIVYFILLKQELKLEKQAKMLEDHEQEQNTYSEKFNFLEKQQVSVCTI